MQEKLTEDALAQTIARLYPDGVQTSAVAICRNPRPLLPDEQRTIAGMSRHRLRQFSHGRACARTVLEALGHGGAAVPVGASRAPVWPAGIVGSISHTHDWAAAAAAPVSIAGGLGLDIEEDGPLPAELRKLVCTTEENRWLDLQPDPGDLAKLIFCAKESLFKCLWPELRTFIDFQQVRLVIDSASGRFTAQTTTAEPWSGLLERLTGRCGQWGRLVLASAWLRP